MRYRLVQGFRHFWVIDVVFTLGPGIDKAKVLQFLAIQLRKGVLMEGNHFLSQIGNAQSAHLGNCASKA